MDNLESIFNNIDEGLLILTVSGKPLFFNGEVEHLYKKIGVTLKEAENIFDVLPKVESSRMQKNIADAVAKKDTLNVFSELTSLEGNKIYLEERYFPTWEEDAAIHVNILTRDITVSKIFEKKITGLANDLRSLIDQANAVIIGTDTRGYITDWNRHTRMLTGYTKNDALAHKFTSLLMGEPDREIFEDIFSQVLEGKPVVNAEIPILNKDGQKLIFLVSATARFNALNQITGIVFVGQDITLRLKVEQEFKFAHERLLFHLENAPLGFIEWDNQMRAKSWTKRAEEIFGWTQQEFSNSGLTGYSQIYDEDLPWVSKISDDLLNGRIERNQVMHRNVCKDGSVIWCEWFNSVLKDDQGKVITLMSLVQDVTERKKNEIRLQEAQAIAHLGNWEMELKSQKVTWSQETFNILGYQADKQEPSLKAYLDVVHPADREKVESIIALSPQTNTPQPFSHRIIRDGKVRTLFINAKYERDASHCPTRLYGTMMDVSDLTEKERQLEQAVEELEAYKKLLERKVEERTQELMQALKKEKDVVEMKGRFVSIASHEFRTPLSSIQHTTNFIRKNKRWTKDAELTNKLKDVEKQTLHMMYLLDDVLTYGKSATSQIQLIVIRLNLKNFIDKIIEDVGHATKNTHTIQLMLQEPDLKIETDEKLLRNILINLLTNAIKYSPGKGIVLLKVESTRHLVKLIVTDYGIGIPIEEQEKIFDAFVRGRSAESIQGTGLGLSIVKKAVELLKGNIKLESEVNVGTTITVTIPKNVNLYETGKN